MIFVVLIFDVLSLWKIKLIYDIWYMIYMIYMIYDIWYMILIYMIGICLVTSFTSIISKTPGEILMLKIFAMSHMGCLFFVFGMYGKRGPIGIPWYQISIPQVFIFHVLREVETIPLVRRVTKIAWLDKGWRGLQWREHTFATSGGREGGRGGPTHWQKGSTED